MKASKLKTQILYISNNNLQLFILRVKFDKVMNNQTYSFKELPRISDTLLSLDKRDISGMKYSIHLKA